MTIIGDVSENSTNTNNQTYNNDKESAAQKPHIADLQKQVSTQTEIIVSMQKTVEKLLNK